MPQGAGEMAKAAPPAQPAFLTGGKPGLIFNLNATA